MGGATVELATALGVMEVIFREDSLGSTESWSLDWRADEAEMKENDLFGFCWNWRRELLGLLVRGRVEGKHARLAMIEMDKGAEKRLW
jgi:hypothetical protein